MQALKQNHQRLISLTLAKKIIIFLAIVLIFDFLLYPLPTLANQEELTSPSQKNVILTEEQLTEITETEQADIFLNNLPENQDLTVKTTSHRLVTAYNSEIGQTDKSPCITANGFDLCQHGREDSVAANFLPFGAKVKMPELFGDKVFIVRDRMNQRFNNRIDVWMVSQADAKQFGVRLAKIQVLE